MPVRKLVNVNFHNSPTLEIPDTINDRPVIGIAEYAFESVGSERIVIPDSVTYIGQGAFSNCVNLTEVVIGDGVTTIPEGLFSNHWDNYPNLNTVILGSGVETIGNSAFAGCEKLACVDLFTCVEKIGDRAFLDCTGYTEIHLPVTLESIGEYAFLGCSNPETLTLSEGLKTIGNNAFEHAGLTSIVIPDSVTSLGDAVFYGCSSLADAKVGNGVKLLNSGLFGECIALRRVEIGDAVKVIPDSMFCNYWDEYSALETVILGESVTTIEECAFAYCRNLSDLQIRGKIQTIGNSAFSWCEKLTNTDLFASVTQISDRAFYGCHGYTEIRLPDSVSKIGSHSFAECDGLKVAVLPANVTELGTNAFAGCDNLTALHILNTDCAIAEDWETLGIPEYVAIYGYAGSTAQTYTEEHGYQFYVHEHECDSWLELQIPTATEPGFARGICTICLEEFTEVLPAGTHKFSEWEITANAACTESGTQQRVCSYCEKVETQEIPALGHSFGDWTVALQPTETSEGKEIRACSACGAEESRSIDKLKPSHIHEYKAVVTEPTCTEKGCTTYTCSCGDSYTADEVAAKGHSFGEWKTTTMPAVGKAGEMTRTCSCGARETKALAALSENFADVADGDWFQSAVAWAATNGVTTGTSPTTFAPGDPCSRAQVVTFLWRAAGSPEPASSKNPFKDVDAGAWYGKAVLWAVEKGITNGMTPTEFGTDQTCTRAQVATFLWRSQGEPAPESSENPFKDVDASAWYGKAVLWAVENGVTNGMGEGTFAPDGTCTRGQIVTFLYRAIA